MLLTRRRRRRIRLIIWDLERPEESPAALIASELGLAAALRRCCVAPLKASGRLGKKRKFLLQQLYKRPDRTCKDERLFCSRSTTATLLLLLLLLLWCCALNAAAGAKWKRREWWKRDVCCDGLTVMAMADPAAVVMVVTLLEEKYRSSTDLQVEDFQQIKIFKSNFFRRRRRRRRRWWVL